MEKYIVSFAKNKIKELGLEDTEVIMNHRINTLARCTNSFIKEKGEEFKFLKCAKIQFHNSVLTLSKEEQEQIALHEIAHYIQAKEGGREAVNEEDYGHGQIFKKICKRIGCKLDSSSTPYPCGKYFLVCNKCDKVVWSANRKTNDLVMTAITGRSGCCHSALTLQQNY